MIYAAPSSTVEIVADNYATGLAGTIGYRVRDNQGADSIARTTVGITEDIAGSGIYRAQFTAPTVAGQYTVIWDSGGATPIFSSEELVITSNSVIPLSTASGPGYWAAQDAALLFPQAIPGQVLISATSNPVNLSVLQTIISLKSVEFDAAAAKAGYLTPIASTATQAWAAAQAVTIDGIRADALEQIYSTQNTPPTYVDRYRKAYDAALKAIKEAERPLTGAAADTSQNGRILPRFNDNGTSIITASMGVGALGFPKDF